MKRTLFLVAMMILCAVSFAQVKFTSMSFEQAQKQAVKENKQLLIDVTTSSKDADEIKEIFKNKDLVKFIKANFLPVRINMMEESNSDFGKHLYSLMYPCVAFYSNQGEQLSSTNWPLIKHGRDNLMELAKSSLEEVQVKRANSRQIIFRDLDYKQALEVAKEEGKLLFVDNYTSWCRPCKKMEMDVFTLNSVADFYNENFVCIKIDADNDPHEVAKKNDVKGFPEYLFFDYDGNVVSRNGGFTPEQEFIGYGKEALDVFNNNKELNLLEIDIVEAMKLAQKEGKHIFVDLSATWCGPCKILKKTTFKSPVVARFYNKNFVSVFVECDIQVDLAAKIKKEYGYSAFPTMLYLDSEGKLLHKIVSAGFPDSVFIAEGQKALDNKGIAYFDNRYETGEKTAEFIKEYLSVLRFANEKDKSTLVTDEYLSKLSVEELKEEGNYDLLIANIQDLDSKPAQMFLANYTKFEAVHERAPIYRNMLWNNKARSFVNDGVLNTEQYNSFIKRLNDSDLSQETKSTIVKESKVANAENTGNWKAYIDLVTADMKKEPTKVPLMVVYNQGLRFNQQCKDEKLRKRFAASLTELLDVRTKAEVDGPMGQAFYDAINKTIEELKK